MVTFKENYHFPRFQRGSNIFQGGTNFFQGRGSNCLFPIETRIACDFSGGGVWTLVPPSPLDPPMPLQGIMLMIRNVLLKKCYHFLYFRFDHVFLGVLNDGLCLG